MPGAKPQSPPPSAAASRRAPSVRWKSRYQAIAVPARLPAASSAKVVGAPSSRVTGAKQDAERDDRGVGHQVHPVRGVEPVGEQGEVAEQDAGVDGQEPLVEGLVLGVERERSGRPDRARARRSASRPGARRSGAAGRSDAVAAQGGQQPGGPGVGSRPGRRGGACSGPVSGAARAVLVTASTLVAGPAGCAGSPQPATVTVHRGRRRAGAARPGGGMADTAALKAAAARRAGSTPAPGTAPTSRLVIRDLHDSAADHYPGRARSRAPTP